MSTEPDLSRQPPRGVAVLRRREVLRRLGISNTTLYAMIRQKLLPAPFNLGPRTQVRLWLESDIDRVLIERAAAAEQPPEAA